MKRNTVVCSCPVIPAILMVVKAVKYSAKVTFSEKTLKIIQTYDVPVGRILCFFFFKECLIKNEVLKEMNRLGKGEKQQPGVARCLPGRSLFALLSPPSHLRCHGSAFSSSQTAAEAFSFLFSAPVSPQVAWILRFFAQSPSSASFVPQVLFHKQNKSEA